MPETERRSYDWLVQHLRLTAFPAPDGQAVSPDWWQELVGSPPDHRAESPKRGLKQTKGRLGDGSLVLEVQPMRIDWRYEPFVSDEGVLLEDIPVLGPLVPAMATFSELMSRWLSTGSIPAIHRMAVGGVFSFPVASREEGYEQILRLVPALRLDPRASSDLLYQINHPRQSNSVGSRLLVNRLTKWSVLAFQILAMAGGSIGQTPKRHSCRLELDINTDGESITPFSREELPRLLSELVDLALEIAHSGDVA